MSSRLIKIIDSCIFVISVIIVEFCVLLLLGRKWKKK